LLGFDGAVGIVLIPQTDLLIDMVNCFPIR